MRWIARRVMNVAMGAFVGTGISVDDDGRLCLPDGLDPDRVQRFIQMCTLETYPHPRAAMHDLFGKVGVRKRIVDLLNEIIHEHGDVDLSAAARHGARLTAALPQFQEIPERFRTFLIEDLAIAEPGSADLTAAVVSARLRAAEQLGCAAEWDAILAHPEQIAAFAAPWRAALASAA